ncbi:hypothetical protein AAKU55_004132 [Oxalobacteraceae bacterium GrIS 1.11]
MSEYDVSKPFGAVRIDVIDRAHVRAFVEGEAAYLRDATSAGLDRQQLSLDRQAALTAYFATLSSCELKKFVLLWTDESSLFNAGRIISVKATLLQSAADDQSKPAPQAGLLYRGVIVLLALLALLIALGR